MPLNALTLTALIALALLATAAGLRTTDEDIQLLAPWLATMLWGVCSLTASNVVVGVDGGEPVTTTMLPVVFTCGGLAALTALYGVYFIVKSPADELERANVDIGRGRQ